MSDIDVKAKERAKQILASQAKGQRVLARDCLDPRTQTERIAVAEQAAVRLEQLLEAADRTFEYYDHLAAIAAVAMAEVEQEEYHV